MKLVYITCATSGKSTTTKSKAISYCKWALGKRVIPINPRTIFSEYLSNEDEIEREYILTLSLSLISKCDEVWFVGFTLNGVMSQELRYALKFRKKIRFISESQIKQGGTNETIYH